MDQLLIGGHRALVAYGFNIAADALQRAMDKIEKMEKALKQIADESDDPGISYIASNALEE